MQASPHILIVDDHREIRDLVSRALSKDGFRVSTAADGQAMRRIMADNRIDLVLLDLMLPGEDGLALCRALRAGSDIPIIMLTAKGEETDIVTGLEIGADDYVPKPFSMRLLLARMKAVLRRAASAADARPQAVTKVHDLTIDDDRHEVIFKDQVVALTLTEYKLLRFLAQHPGRVFTRTQILNNIQDEHVIVIDRAIDVHVAALRKKLGDAGRYIETVRGVGYRYKE
jgi:two-component system phosphate regulon response regulator PhoB